MIVRVPASSANLGPGFDTLGMALTLHLEAGLAGPAAPRAPVDDHHPTQVAFAKAGGEGRVWVHSPIPMGRGLGFSGAARVAGALLGALQQLGDGAGVADAAAEVLTLTTALEGHADNVAASLFGGVVATAGGLVVPVPLAVDPAVVVWVPPSKTSTDESRGKVRRDLSFDDAVFNVGRTALLVAALAAGEVRALRCATQDRLHQELRLAAAPASALAMRAALDAGAWCAWLSGSGPTVAALCPVDQAESLAAALPADGAAKVLRIDHEGAVVERDG